MSLTDNIGAIRAEDWKAAPGISEDAKRGTNAGLASRDYSVPCKTKYTIAVIHGFHVWWCSAHHQPISWCERGKSLERVIAFARMLIDRERVAPPPGMAWKPVAEMASDFIKSVNEYWR